MPDALRSRSAIVDDRAWGLPRVRLMRGKPGLPYATTSVLRARGLMVLEMPCIGWRLAVTPCRHWSHNL